MRIDYWKRGSTVRLLTQHILFVFGVCWLIVEPLGLFFPSKLEFGWYGYLILFGFSFFIGLYLTRPKVSATSRLPFSDTRISVEIADLLERKDIVVIGTCDTFDTEIGDTISKLSLQGAFQSKYFPNTTDLDRSIEDALMTVKGGKEDRRKSFGKKIRYPIGSTVMLKSGDVRFFLVAYTRMGDDKKVESDICRLSSALRDLWDSIRVRGEHQPVNIGVVGSGLSRIGLSRALLIQFIVLSFLDAQRRESVSPSLSVCVSPKDAHLVDFNFIESWMRGLKDVA